jgi:hypothetical protein
MKIRPVIAPFIVLSDPRVVLHYGDRYIDVCDHITHCVGVDLWCDLGLHTTQPAYNILVFEEPAHVTLAALYLCRYDSFTYTVEI